MATRMAPSIHIVSLWGARPKSCEGRCAMVGMSFLLVVTAVENDPEAGRLHRGFTAVAWSDGFPDPGPTRSRGGRAGDPHSGRQAARPPRDPARSCQRARLG